MIEIKAKDALSYFERSVFDEMFDMIKETVNKQVPFFPETFIGCICFPNVPLKDGSEGNVYIDYGGQIISATREGGPTVTTALQNVIIYHGEMPDYVNQKIKEVEAIIKGYSSLN